MAAMPGSQAFGFDAFAPEQIAERVNELGVAKARLPLLSILMLGMLAGAFIGLGSLFFVIVQSDASLGFAARRVLGGAVFSLGLLLVVVAGAELFAPDALPDWALVRNLVPVIAGNLVGGSILVALVYHVIYLRPKRLRPASLEPDHDATPDHQKEPAR
jgi:formate transporter